MSQTETERTRKPFVRPPDHEERMAQARKRAGWELGDESWAGVILGAYLYPDHDAEELKREQRELDGESS